MVLTFPSFSEHPVIDVRKNIVDVFDHGQMVEADVFVFHSIGQEAEMS